MAINKPRITKLPKPRMRFVNDVWVCWLNGYIGNGISIDAAYKDWKDSYLRGMAGI